MEEAIPVTMPGSSCCALTQLHKLCNYGCIKCQTEPKMVTPDSLYSCLKSFVQGPYWKLSASTSEWQGSIIRMALAKSHLACASCSNTFPFIRQIIKPAASYRASFYVFGGSGIHFMIHLLKSVNFIPLTMILQWILTALRKKIPSLYHSLQPEIASNLLLGQLPLVCHGILQAHQYPKPLPAAPLAKVLCPNSPHSGSAPRFLVDITSVDELMDNIHNLDFQIVYGFLIILTVTNFTY